LLSTTTSSAIDLMLFASRKALAWKGRLDTGEYSGHIKR